MGSLRHLDSCIAKAHFLFTDETTEFGCDLLPRAWFPTLLKAEYSLESVESMYDTCNVNDDGGVSFKELRDCFETDGG